MSASRIAIAISLTIVTALAVSGGFLLRGIPSPPVLGPVGIKGKVTIMPAPGDEFMFMNDRIDGALVEVFDVNSRELLAKTYSDAWGRYAVTIPAAVRCRIVVSKPPAYEKSELKDRNVDGQVAIDVELLPCDSRR